MIQQGWAKVYVQYAEGKYTEDEAFAKINGLGVWGMSEDPWTFRYKR
jgi:endonuclease YncB( thermonuclease family)